MISINQGLTFAEQLLQPTSSSKTPPSGAAPTQSNPVIDTLLSAVKGPAGGLHGTGSTSGGSFSGTKLDIGGMAMGAVQGFLTGGPMGAIASVALPLLEKLPGPLGGIAKVAGGLLGGLFGKKG